MFDFINRFSKQIGFKPTDESEQKSGNEIGDVAQMNYTGIGKTYTLAGDIYTSAKAESDRQDFYMKMRDRNQPDTYQERYELQYKVNAFVKYFSHLLSTLTGGLGGLVLFFYLLGIHPPDLFSGRVQLADFDTVKLVLGFLGVLVLILFACWNEIRKNTFLKIICEKIARNEADQVSHKREFKRHRSNYLTTVIFSVLLSVIGGILINQYLSDKSGDIKNNADNTISSAISRYQNDSLRLANEYAGLIANKNEAIQAKKEAKAQYHPVRYKTKRNQIQNEINQLMTEKEKLVLRKNGALGALKNERKALKSETLSEMEGKLDANKGSVWIGLIITTLLISLAEIMCFISTKSRHRYQAECEAEGVRLLAIPLEQSQSLSPVELFGIRQTQMMHQLGEMMKTGLQGIPLGPLQGEVKPGQYAPDTSRMEMKGFRYQPKTEEKSSPSSKQNLGQNPDQNFSQILGQLKDEILGEIKAQFSAPEVAPQTAKKSGKFAPSAVKNETRNFSKHTLMNLNPETPYNLGKKYNMGKAEKKKLAEVRKVYLAFTQKEGKRPTLTELTDRCGKSLVTVKKYVEMMQKEGQVLLRKRGEPI